MATSIFARREICVRSPFLGGRTCRRPMGSSGPGPVFAIRSASLARFGLPSPICQSTVRTCALPCRSPSASRARCGFCARTLSGTVVSTDREYGNLTSHVDCPGGSVKQYIRLCETWASDAFTRSWTIETSDWLQSGWRERGWPICETRRWRQPRVDPVHDPLVPFLTAKDRAEVLGRHWQSSN